MSHKKIGWFSSGGGSGSRGLFLETAEAISSGRIDASIEFLFCNREYGEDENTDRFLNLVETYKIPIITISSRKFRKLQNAKSFSEIRSMYDNLMLEKINSFSVDFSVSAGYGLIFSDQVVEGMLVLNLHPAAPSGPVGTWQQVINSLIEDRSEEHGLMVHIATSDMDRGPVLTYLTFPIIGDGYDALWVKIKESNDETAKEILFDLIRNQGLIMEPVVLLRTIKIITEDIFDLELLRNEIDANALQPICLNDQFTNNA